MKKLKKKVNLVVKGLKKKGKKNIKNIKFEKKYTKYRAKGKYYFYIKMDKLLLGIYNNLLLKPNSLIKRFMKRFLIKKRLLKAIHFEYLKILYEFYRSKRIIITNNNNTNNIKQNFIKNIFMITGYYSVISLTYYKITDYQIELIRRIFRRICGKNSNIKMLINATSIVLKRTNLVRMGGGKGSKFSKKIYFLKPGSKIIEIYGASFRCVRDSYEKILYKIPIKLKLIFEHRI